MSQKEKKFQPKSKNFAGRGGGGFSGRGGKPGGKSGGKPGDKSFDKPRSGSGGGKKPPGRGFGQKFEGDRDARRPRREGGEFKPRRTGGEFRPRREGGEFKPRRESGEFKPRREGSEFKPRRPREEGEFRPKRTFSERKPRRDDREGTGFKGGFKKSRKPDDGRFESRGPRTKRYDEKPSARKPAPRRRDDFDAPAPFAASEDTRRKLKSDRPGYGAPSSAYLYGHHAVRAALQNPARHIQRLIVTESGFENIRDAYDAALAAGLRRPEPVFVEKEDIDRLLPRDAVHQDVIADVKPLEDVFLQDVLNAADDSTKVIVLDQVTDPHNVGAILRTAAAFGAAAVIVQKLHAPDITGTLAKAASGAVEHVPLVREVNLSRALGQLREAGFTCIGLDERGKATIAEAAVPGRVALVMGAEGDGLRRLVAENCDVLAKLPTSGPIASLNVSNAAAVALYEAIRGHDG